MTELVITPKWKDKTARFKGTVAAGEHVAVTIEGTGSIVDRTNLRLRVFGWQGEVLAQFPMPDSADAWDGEGGGDGDGEEGDVVAYSTLSCTLNLNAAPLLKSVPPGATMQFLFVLDDAENYTLYFKDLCDITHWPERVGDDTPYDLDDWPRQIDEWTALVADFGDRLTTAETDIGQAESRVNAAIAAIPQTVSTAVTQSNSGKADKVANATGGNLAALDANGNLVDSGKGVAYFATASGLTTEQAARIACDNALSDSIRALANDVASRLATKQNTLSQAQMNAVNSGVTAQKVSQYDGYAAIIETKAGKTEMNAAVANAVASILANAPADYDTLKEIADYIESDQTGAAAIATRVAALETGKQNKLTFDTTPTQGSANPVTSGGVYTALSDKASAADVTALQTAVDGKASTADVEALQTAVAGKASETSVENLELAYQVLSGTISGMQTAIQGAGKYPFESQRLENPLTEYPSIALTPFKNTQTSGEVEIEAGTDEIVVRQNCEIGITVGALPSGDTGVMRDLIWTFDLTDARLATAFPNGVSMYWAESDFYPANGDASNLEPENGKINVYMITEFSPGKFLVARQLVEAAA